jgi:glutamate-1-semialdehyde 2,1-aminomutase
MISRHKAQEYMARARKSLPGGISSGVRGTEQPCPMCYVRGKEARIFDLDGNEYIDYVLGQGPLILGHSPKPVIDAVTEQLSLGIIFAGQHEAEAELAELLQQIIPCAEMVRFNSTGSEAIHAALRLARAYTGKKKIIRFEGQYHGWFDNIFISYAPPLSKAGPREAPTPILGTSGQPESVLQDVIVLPWNDLSIFAKTVAAHRDEIAGVITEPAMLNNGGILPREGYLEGLRDVCTKNGIVLIFDEVITGFRMALGGAQTHYGVTPDLATYAKAMAGGFPLSAVVGKREIMSLISRGEVMHAGTYNSNPIVVAAGLATVKELAKDNGALYSQMFDLSEQLQHGLRQELAAAGFSAQVIRAGTVLYLNFTSMPTFRDYRDAANRDTETYARFLAALADRGVRTCARGIWFLSASHNREDVDFTLQAVKDALGSI